MEVSLKFEFDPEKFLLDIIKAKRGYDQFYKVAIGDFFDPTINYKWVLKWIIIGLSPILLLIVFTMLRGYF